MNFSKQPILVFWEGTRACGLACRHCRAEAQPDPLPGELTSAEGRRLLDAIRAFGDPPPVVVFTGGDPLRRPDFWELLDYARGIGLTPAISPAVTPLLDAAAMRRLAAAGAHSVSISIDAGAAAHDELRGVPGTYARSLQAVRDALAAGLQVQVNTVVMRHTLEDLPAMAAMLLREGVPVWEVFFLVVTGRALAEQQLPPEEIGDVCRLLLDASAYGLTVRTVEGPFIRRVFADPGEGGPTYHRLSAALRELAGPPPGRASIGRRGTLDGDGILFVAYDGRIMPGGLLPVSLGNVRTGDLVETYRSHPLLADIRVRRFHGPCGECDARDICGGSRARSFAATGDALGSDPACPLVYAGR